MKILLITVGGSHAPILKAIAFHRPDRTIFFVTDRDPLTNAPGSLLQITGKGKVIKARPEDEKPSLPNIPDQAGLSPDQWEAVVVAADHFDECFAKILATGQRLRREWPDAQLVSDYTGGTKTMSAALVTVAVELGMYLSLVTGPRPDLVGVHCNELVRPVSVERLRFSRLQHQLDVAFSAYAFDTALRLLEQHVPSDADMPAYTLYRVQCQLFDAWDRFQYQEAFDHFTHLNNRLAPLMGTQVSALQRLAELERHGVGQSWKCGLAQLVDLWHNAGRRAACGRYDDAVARWYRFLEALAQNTLLIEHGIRTADLSAERDLPEELLPPLTQEGTRPAGLFQSYRLLAHLSPDHEVSKMFTEHSGRLRDLIAHRNHSLLAHGSTPVDQKTWQRVAAFVAEAVWPVIESLAVRNKTRLAQPWPALPLRETSGAESTQ